MPQVLHIPLHPLGHETQARPTTKISLVLETTQNQQPLKTSLSVSGGWSHAQGAVCCLHVPKFAHWGRNFCLVRRRIRRSNESSPWMRYLNMPQAAVLLEISPRQQEPEIWGRQISHTLTKHPEESLLSVSRIQSAWCVPV